MTIQFKVDSTYTLGLSIKLTCTYIEDNTVWFVHRVNPLADVVDCVHYKLNKKTDKLYKFNVAFSSWDTVENTLSEYGPSEIWDFRKKGGVSNYLE